MYTSHADLGALPDAGPVAVADDGVLFHGPWEARVFALTLAMGATGAWNLDMSRSARETLPRYRQLDYYGIWLAALEKLLLERGLVTHAELQAGRPLGPTLPALRVLRVLRGAQVAAVLAAGAPTAREARAAARFAPGDHVRMNAAPAAHHTRLPGYLRGRQGVVERVHGAHVFADANARGMGEDAQWLYTVVFHADEGHSVSCDAFEPYLQAD